MIKVGTIINTRGLKGECKIYLVTDDVEHRFAKGRKLFLEDGSSLSVCSFQVQKGFGYAKFEEITSIEQAERLKNQSLWIPKENLPQLDQDEFYYHELMDCKVYNQNQEYLGNVVDILETGANIVLRVQNENTSFLLPFVKAFVPEVDRINKTIIIEEMDGLR